MMMREALPAEAVKTDKTYGSNEVWETVNWQYLVESGTRNVLNVVAKDKR